MRAVFWPWAHVLCLHDVSWSITEVQHHSTLYFALVHTLEDIVELIHLLDCEMGLDDAPVTPISLVHTREQGRFNSPCSHLQGLDSLFAIAHGTSNDLDLFYQHSGWIGTTDGLGCSLLGVLLAFYLQFQAEE